MVEPTLVYEERDELETRLGQLGLTVEDLHAAIRIGYMARLSCNLNDPPSSVGILFWGRTTRGLRERLAPQGWKKNDAKLSTTVNSDETVAIVVSTGDDDTGIASGFPKTRFAKGPATREAVAQNAGQGELFSLQEVVKAPPTNWILLVSIERQTDKTVIHSELSRPSEMDDDGRVGQWYERIVLPAIEDNDEGGRITPSAGLEPGPDLEVDVRRRAV